MSAHPMPGRRAGACTATSRIALAACLFVAACATPQEQCIADATGDLRNLDRRIAETEGNLRRGHAIETVTVTDTLWTVCRNRGPTVGEVVEGGGSWPSLCLEEVPRSIQRPKAIDPDAERASLAAMRARRADLARTAGQAVAACRARFPGWCRLSARERRPDRSAFARRPP